MAVRQEEQEPARQPMPQTEAHPLAVALEAEELFREPEARAHRALFGLLPQAEAQPVPEEVEEEKQTQVLRRKEAQEANAEVAEVPAVTRTVAWAVTAASSSPIRQSRLPPQARLPTRASPQAPSP